MAITVNQLVWRTRTDATAAQGGAPVWAAAQNTNVVVQSGVAIRVRIGLNNSGTTADTGNKYNLGVAINGLSPVSSIIGISDLSPVDPTHGGSADGQTLTTSLLTGTGTFSGTGKYCTGGNASVSSNIPAGDYIEMEYGIQFNSPYCDGNNYQFFVYRGTAGIEHYGAGLPKFFMAAASIGTLAATEADDAITAAGNVPRAAALSIIEVADSLTGQALETNPAHLAVTEANDALTGTALTADRGALNATEANDVLTGVATGPDFAALAVTEANDALTGTAFQAAVGSITGVLTTAEANDALVGLGSVVGVVGSMILIEGADTLASVGVRSSLEDDDTLMGFAGIPLGAMLNAAEDNDALVSATLSGVNQWFPIPPSSGVWFEVGP